MSIICTVTHIYPLIRLFILNYISLLQIPRKTHFITPKKVRASVPKAQKERNPSHSRGVNMETILGPSFERWFVMNMRLIIHATCCFYSETCMIINFSIPYKISCIIMFEIVTHNIFLILKYFFKFWY